MRGQEGSEGTDPSVRCGSAMLDPLRSGEGWSLYRETPRLWLFPVASAGSEGVEDKHRCKELLNVEMHKAIDPLHVNAKIIL